MRVLVIGKYHHKNKEGLNCILRYLGLEFRYGTVSDIPNFDIIFSSHTPINTSKYPNKKFVFGPHFSVFPDNDKLRHINNVHRNSIYIQPSGWVVNLWKNKYIPVKVLPFPVQTNKFKPINDKRDKIFIYIKHRNPRELGFLKSELNKRNIPYVIFDYVKRYNEKDYLYYLQLSKYGVILDAHESQGFAIEEALSCDVPLLVWSVTTMNQEYKSRYPPISCTSVPYWDERCGEIFYKQEEFEPKFAEFISKLDTYKPREYILENLSDEKCAEQFKKLIT